MIKNVVNFKFLVDFFIFVGISDKRKERDRKKNFLKANEIINLYNSYSGNTLKQNLYTCKVKELTLKRFMIWQSYYKILKIRFGGTEYEKIIREKYEKKKNYIENSLNTYQSISSYYSKLDNIYQYIYTLAYHDDLIEIF